MKKKMFSREFFQKTGAEGGKAKGQSKVRGDSNYYRQLRKKAVKK